MSKRSMIAEIEKEIEFQRKKIREKASRYDGESKMLYGNEPGYDNGYDDGLLTGLKIARTIMYKDAS